MDEHRDFVRSEVDKRQTRQRPYNGFKVHEVLMGDYWVQLETVYEYAFDFGEAEKLKEICYEI